MRRFRHPLPDDDLIIFQFAHALLEGGQHSRFAYVENTFEQFVYIPFDPDELRGHGLFLVAGIGAQRIPPFAQHALGDTEQRLVRLRCLDQGFKLAFDLLAADGFAVALASAFRAEIVRMAACPPFRPAGRQRRAAIGAQHIAAQRKILVEVAAARRGRLAIELVLHALEGLVRNQAFVLAFAQRDVPFLRLDISRVDRIAQQDRHALVADRALPVLGEQRMILEEAHDIGGRVEPAGRQAFECFLHDGGDGLLAAEHPAAILDRVILIADRRLERPIAVHDAGAHAPLGLLGVLLAEMLCEGGMDILHHHGIRIVLEFHLRADEPAACLAQKVAQIPMAAHVAGKAVDGIDDRRITGVAVFLEELQHLHHAGAVDVAARHAVGEDLMDIVAREPCVFPAGRFLRAQGVSALAAFFLADAAVDDGRFHFAFDHGAPPLPSFSDGVSSCVE